MAQSLRKPIRPYVDPATGRGRWGIACVAIYVVLSALTTAWGLSGSASTANDLGAVVMWDDPGAPFSTLVITNRGDEGWTGVRVVLDGRYYAHAEEVGEGQSRAFDITDFRDSLYLPRPDGMYGYERYYPRPDRPSNVVPPGYRPEEVLITTDQGEATARRAP